MDRCRRWRGLGSRLRDRLVRLLGRGIGGLGFGHIVVGHSQLLKAWWCGGLPARDGALPRPV